jgi:hypothetical protein
MLVDLGSTNKTLREALPMVELSHRNRYLAGKFPE